jgi:hypothetical protein
VERNSKKVVNCTKEIIDAPYDPHGWYLRAAALLELGYPELAVGDSYKSTTLCDAGLDYTSILGESVRLQFGMSTWILDEAVDKTTDDGEFFRLHINNLLKIIQKSAYMVMVNSAKELLASWDSLRISQEAFKEISHRAVLFGVPITRQRRAQIAGLRVAKDRARREEET